MNYAIAIDMVLRGNPSIGFAADTGGEDIWVVFYLDVLSL
jgi:hypothetical protein